MSFHMDFKASKEEALAKVANAHAPQSVKDFIIAAISAHADADNFQIKAQGHLHNGTDYEVSSANIEVRPDHSDKGD